MIGRIAVIILTAALSGCGAAVSIQGEKVVGEDLVALISGTTIHGRAGKYYREYTETHRSDGSYEIAFSKYDKEYGIWEARDDRLCYKMDDESEFTCVYVYAVNDYIQFVSIKTSQIVAFSSDVKYSRDVRRVAPPAPPPTVVSQERRLTSTGSGFIVSTETFVLTNAHVVEDCEEVRIRTKDRSLGAVIASRDVKNDLALLRLPPEAQPVAVFQALDTLYPGDSVVALGFPLRGVLASEANVSVGTVSALAGLGNDTSKLQISAPVQPGNSGGPLFDKSGLVVGVIVSRLDDKAAMEVLGVIPQNVNFAIKSQAAMALMRASDVRFTQEKSNAQMTAAEIARNARQYTVPIECWS